MNLESLRIADLLQGYATRRFTVTQVMEHVLASVARSPERHVWISRLPPERVMAHARALEAKSPDSLPLYGVPFAIKDNIDLSGIATTAGCPDYAYMPVESSFVVQRLLDAGAVPVGKTNLDQFATGLVGTRSPYGACRNACDDAYVSGGSSSGSAVAVASGAVSFSLGTDTAGSGRVPAAFNNIIGLKPTCGWLSTSGVVPACRSIDCVSIFALTSNDAARVAAVAGAYDRADPYSRMSPWASVRSDALLGARTIVSTSASLVAAESAALSSTSFRFGVPQKDQLEFFGDADYERLFDEAVQRLESLGGERIEVDFAPFRAAAKLLYESAWIAERYVAVGEFIERHPQSVHPVTRQLIEGSRGFTAADAFRAHHSLMAAKRDAAESWGDIEVLVTPTTGTIYRIADVEADPIRLNANLGFYTNFVNFLDLAAVAVPAGFRRDGLPFGVTLVGPAWSDASLLSLADRLHRASVRTIGALDASLPQADGECEHLRSATAAPAAFRASGAPPVVATGERIAVAVCGAHLEGLPLNPQLTSRGATLVRRTRTAPRYRFYALPGGPPFRPGLIRVAEGGASVEVEVWSVPAEHVGSFVAGIPAPLGIGQVELEDGARVCGFICEGHAAAGAEDITSFGGWRAYLSSKR